MPLAVERAEGSGHELGRAAAARALLGLGLGVDARGACAVLAAAPAAAYLQAPLGRSARVRAGRRTDRGAPPVAAAPRDLSVAR